MYKINFNHLYYFLTIAKEGSIVKASKKLHITQPALSQQLKIFEQDLGKQLFDRVGKKLVINEHGENVREYGEKIFRHSEEMIHVLKSDIQESIKILKVGLVPWASREKLFEKLKPLMANPYVKMQLIVKDYHPLIEDLKTGKVDVVFTDAPYTGRTKKLVGRRISTEPLICVAPTSLKLKGSFPQNINQKKVVNFPEESLVRDKIDEFILKNKLNLEISAVTGDLTTMKIFVENSRDWLAFIPQSEAQKHLKLKKIKKIGELEKYKFSLWAIVARDLDRKSLVSTLLR